MAKVSALRAPWRSLLICIVAALVIPIWYYGQLYLEIRRGRPAALNLIEASKSDPGLAGIAQYARIYETTANRLWARTLLGEVVVSLALALLTCWIVYRRRAKLGGALAARVLTDVGLVLAFLAAPWLVPAVGFLHFPRGNPIQVWVFGNVLPNALPCLVASTAAVAFYLVSRKWVRVGDVA